MYEYAVDTNSGQFKAPFNQIKNEPHVYTYKDTAFITPNSDTPYSFVWMDLRAEPMVLSVPAVERSRYYSVQLCDGNTYNYGYIGSRATGTEPGDYMVVGPDWKAATPAGIKKVFRSTTQFSVAGYPHPALQSDDMTNVEKVQAGYKAQTAFRLSETTGDGRRSDNRLLPTSTGNREEEFLPVSRLRAAVRSRPGGEKEIRAKLAKHRRRPRQDLRLQGTPAGAQSSKSASA